MKNRTSIALENINRDLGKELAEKRYNAGLTQTQVIDKLERREKEALVNLGLSEEEADACIYAEGEELSPELKRKLRKVLFGKLNAAVSIRLKRVFQST